MSSGVQKRKRQTQAATEARLAKKQRVACVGKFNEQDEQQQVLLIGKALDYVEKTPNCGKPNTTIKVEQVLDEILPTFAIPKSAATISHLQSSPQPATTTTTNTSTTCTVGQPHIKYSQLKDKKKRQRETWEAILAKADNNCFEAATST